MHFWKQYQDTSLLFKEPCLLQNLSWNDMNEKCLLRTVISNRGKRRNKFLGTFFVFCLYTVGLNWSETVKKMTAKYDDIFVTYEHSWVGRKWFFLKLCLATRGRCNRFSQNWNFELKIFLDIHFMTKIGSMGLWIYCLSKNESKWPKDHTCNIFRPSSKILKWAKFLKFEAFKHCGSNF